MPCTDKPFNQAFQTLTLVSKVKCIVARNKMADLAAKSWKSDKMAISGDEMDSHLSVAAELRNSGFNIQLLLL